MPRIQPVRQESNIRPTKGFRLMDTCALSASGTSDGRRRLDPFAHFFTPTNSAEAQCSLIFRSILFSSLLLENSQWLPQT